MCNIISFDKKGIIDVSYTNEDIIYRENITDFYSTFDGQL